ncbi:hypothetical protein EUX98_g1673 [Antrodiella citrinella]|uniref:Uncharacterized protein n=1 Tax=Antrodiella citrinella TaxID=2447956 RepID=A0A4S4N0T5_9APHY|nr:hypothetical protein EUX98_g1673 [Antrodiella citrinella]
MITCTVLQPCERNLSVQKNTALGSLCSISTANSLPIPVATVQSLLMDTPSYRALLDSNSTASFPERRLDDDDDSYETHLDYLLQRSAQLLKHRQDEDLFQKKTVYSACPLPVDDFSGSDSSSQAEYGSRSTLSQESDPELEAALTTYYAPPRTVASLVTLPSLHKAALASHPLSPHDSWPTIPSESSRSTSLGSLASIEEAHKMIWQLEEIANELKSLDNSVPSLARIQPSMSSIAPPPPLPDIPLPPLPSSPSPLSDSKLLPSPWSVNSLPRGDSRASNLTAASMAHSLAYLKTESTASVLKDQAPPTPDISICVPQIIVTEPSSEHFVAETEESSVKDATLLMDLVDCDADNWDTDNTSLQTAKAKVPPEMDCSHIPSVPARKPPQPPQIRRRVSFDDVPRVDGSDEKHVKKWYQRRSTREAVRPGGSKRAVRPRNKTPPPKPQPPTRESWFRRIFSRSTDPGPTRPRPCLRARPPPKNIRAQPISYPTPIIYRKSWPACAVDPVRVRKSMGEPMRDGRRRAVSQPVESEFSRRRSAWEKFKEVFTR